MIKPFMIVNLLALIIFATGPCRAEENSVPKVVASIKPIHSLVAGVMQGVSSPYLLLKGASSPHHFQLKPSDAVRLKRADLVVWVGPSLETPLEKVVNSLANKSASMVLIKTPLPELFVMRSAHQHHHSEEHHEAH